MVLRDSQVLQCVHTKSIIREIVGDDGGRVLSRTLFQSIYFDAFESTVAQFAEL